MRHLPGEQEDSKYIDQQVERHDKKSMYSGKYKKLGVAGIVVVDKSSSRKQYWQGQTGSERKDGLSVYG